MSATPNPSLANPSLAAQIGNVVSEPALMNASGPRRTYDDELLPLAKSRVGAVVLKSATFAPRAGNAEPRLSTDARAGTSLNSNGLCNLGYEAHAEQIARLREECGKPVIASLAALDSTQFPTMARRVGEVASAIELNLSCPNVPGKPQIAFDLEASERVLGEVRAATPCDLWVKLPPFQDRRMVEAMAALLARSGVQAAVCINSPSGLELDLEDESTRIHPNDGMGGAGGRDILRITRWNVRQFWLALRAHGVAVIGTGGVEHGADAYGHVLCGAAAVQLGTSYLIEGPEIFERVEREVAAELSKRGVAKLAEKVGALKVLAARAPT